jgi:hypothetical protein
VARRRPDVELDEGLIEAVHAMARRSGVAEGELYERALRVLLARDFAALMDEVAEHQATIDATVGDEAALQLAVDQVRASRGDRKSDM